MIHLSKKCSLEEYKEKVNCKLVKDIKYADITFKLNQEKFYNKY